MANYKGVKQVKTFTSSEAITTQLIMERCNIRWTDNQMEMTTGTVPLGKNVFKFQVNV